MIYAFVRRPPAPRLDEGTKGYYKRVESVLEDGGSEEGELFLRNVTDQVISDGVRLVSCDKDGSRALESLLQHFSSDTESLKKLMMAVQPDFFKLCVNRCGSHVMQTLLHSASSALSSHTHTQSGPDEELMKLFLSLIATVQDKVLEYLRHPYASHVLGSVLQDLSGVYLDEQVGRSRYSREFRKAKMVVVGVKSGKKATLKAVPDKFVERLGKIARTISKAADLKDLLTHQNASPVLQCLLRVLAEQLPDKLERLVKRILKHSKVLGGGAEAGEEEEEGMDTLPEMFTDLVGSHLMEAMLQVATPQLSKLIFSMCFKGRVMMSALHPVANFPLQHLIQTSDPQQRLQLNQFSVQLSEVVAEVSSLEEILFVGHTGVVVKLAEASITAPDVQSTLLPAILQAFHVDTHPLSSAPVILALLTYEVFSSQEDGKQEGGEEEEQEGRADEGQEGVEGEGKITKSHPTSLHGSLLLQALLQYEDVKVVSRSMVKLSVSELVRLSCDSHGSHAITAFISSNTVPAKRKERLRKKLEANLVSLSADRYGSRVVDVLWKHSELEKREELARTLLAHEEHLTQDFYGSIVLRNCNIAHYRKQQAGWLEQQKAAEKRQLLFQDMLNEGQSSSVDKKQQKRTASMKDSDDTVFTGSRITGSRKKKRQK